MADWSRIWELLPPGSFSVDPFRVRIRRMQGTVRESARQYEDEVRWEERRAGRPLYRRLFVTLTYASNTKGSAGDLPECIRLVRQWGHRQGVHIRIVWVAESQKRGALHYHLLLWLPRRLRLPMLDRRGWWKHGMTKVERARNPVGYLVKYASKGTVCGIASLRKGARLYGYGGGWPHGRERIRTALRSRWIRKAVQGVADAAWARQVEAEIDAQEREEAALLHAWDPDRHPPPPPEYESEDAYAEAVLRDMEEQQRCERRDALLRAGRSVLERVAGGYRDRVYGTFFESPYRVEMIGRVVVVIPKWGTFKRDEVNA